MKRYLTYFIIFLTYSLGLAQNITPLPRNFQKSLSDCGIVEDSLTILPSTVHITDSGNDSVPYTIDNRSIIIEDSYCKDHQEVLLNIAYRVLPYDVEKTYRSPYIDRYQKQEKPITYTELSNKGSYSIIESEELDYNGSFSRGLSLGNSQDFLLNSNFNMTMSGEIGDGIEVLASISDQNLPIQPQGNTQLIQDFDRVFIKVSKDSTSVIAGDYTIQRPQSYFINTLKKIKGLQVNNTTRVTPEYTLSSMGNVAISRGKYARHMLTTTEGNQGPYRLRPQENSRFIIILSGTEKVYLDDQLLTRGFNNDYVIDYNTAEITFTSRRFIGPETRVIVEYEYRDQNYLRTLYSGGTTIQNNRLTGRFYIHSEQDSKNALGDLVLDSLDFLQLTLLGDDIENNYVNSIRRVRDTASLDNTITYEYITSPSSSDSILVYSTDKNKTLYTAAFTEVGSDNGGAYIIDPDNRSNGRVYKYVGESMGTYLPVIPLTPPEKKQIMSFNVEHKARNGMHSFAEISVSNNDLNRYAEIGNSDNVGVAGKIALDKFFFQDSAQHRSLYTQADVELVQKSFQPLNAYRNVEFARDWNVQQVLSGENEVLSSFSARYNHNKNLSLSHDVSYYGIADDYDGLRNITSLAYKSKHLRFTGRYNHLNSEATDLHSTFIRPFVESYMTMGTSDFVTVKMGFDAEYNKAREVATDLLNPRSNRYENYHLTLGLKPNKTIQTSITGRRRHNYYIRDNEFSQSYDIEELMLSAEVKNRNQLETSFGVRSIKLKDQAYDKIDEKVSLMGLLRYNYDFFNEGIQGTTTLNSLSGQEPKTEYVYEQVEAGQGTYIYVGNPDSTLINANFRYAPELGTADYIRLTQFNNEYILTQNTDFNQTLKIFPHQLLGKDKKAFIARFSSLHSLRYLKKTLGSDDNFLSNLNVFSIDTSIVTYQAAVNNTLFFNRGQAKGDVRIGQRLNQNLLTQIAGEEGRKRKEWFIAGRWNAISTIDFLLEAAKGEQLYESELNPERDYILDIWSLKPSISIRFNDRLRWITAYEYGYKNDILQQQAKATNHSISTELNLRSSSLSNLSASFTYSGVNYTGKQNSIIEFEILEGLKDGNNFRWNTIYTRRMANNIDLSFQYEGRKNGDQRIVNIGRAQVKATF